LTNSLEMDNEDLLFNMLYFSSEEDAGGAHLSIGSVINNAMSETVALHSENNTPYKLRPVPEDDIRELEPETLESEGLNKMRQEYGDISVAVECAVCKENLILGEKVIRLPTCHHNFHAECLLKWFTMQNFCPICRTPLSTKTGVVGLNENEKLSGSSKQNGCAVNGLPIKSKRSGHPVPSSIPKETGKKVAGDEREK